MQIILKSILFHNFIFNNSLGLRDKFNNMVLLNYEKVIKEKLAEQAERMGNPLIVSACKDSDFEEFMIKLYEYCEEINIIEQRMDILAKETEKL